MSHSAHDHHLPLIADQVIETLRAAAGNDVEQRQFLRISRLMEAVFHWRTHQMLGNLRHRYDLLDPDGPHVKSEDRDEAAALEVANDFIDDMCELLERANYRRLSRAEIEEAAAQVSTWGVRPEIDLSAFHHLVVYARGNGATRLRRRTPKKPWKWEDTEIHHYERLVVAFALKPNYQIHENVQSSAVYLKLFKEIPHANVDTLLPTSAFQMSWWDRLKIALPTISGIGLATYKIILGGIIIAWARLLALLGLIGGTLGYGVRSFLGYLRTKDKYQLTLTRSLYYQNLDNNAGVLFRVLDEAEQQDFLEALLAYAMLRERAPEGLTADELDRCVEKRMESVWGVVADFEVSDATSKLNELGIAQCNAGGKWTALPYAEAYQRLLAQWDSICDFAHPRQDDSHVSPPMTGRSRQL